MKKIITLASILLTTIILLGSYYGMGYLTERALNKSISTLNSSNEIKVSIEKYQRHWFYSDVILNVELLIPGRVVIDNDTKIFKPTKRYSAEMPLQIYHGPIIFKKNSVNFGLGVATSHLTLPPKYLAEFQENYTSDSIKPSLDLDVYVNYLGSTAMILKAPKFKLAAKDSSTNFEWLGMTSYTQATPDLHHISGNCIIKGLSWFKDNITSKLNYLESEFNLIRNEIGLYLGSAKLYLPLATVMKENKELIEMAELTLNSNSSMDKNLFNSSLKVSLDKLFINNVTYRNFSFLLSFSNLDANVLVDMNKRIARVKHQSDIEKHRVILSLLPDLPMLLNNGAVIAISDFSLEMTGGKLGGYLTISLPKDTGNTNPFQLAQKITGNGRLDFSRGLLQEFLKDLYKTKYLAQQEMSKKTSNEVEKVGDEKNHENQSTAAVNGNHDARQATSKTGGDKSITPEELDEMAQKLADEKILYLQRSGAIVPASAGFAIVIKILNGRFMINDHPFNPIMLQL